jgi:release factor glutamine methyltransferase
MPAEPVRTPVSPTSWTIKNLLAWTTDYLNSKGIPSARLEAQILLAHVLSCRRIELMVRYEEVPPESLRAQFRELVKRRVEHWPVAYLIGQREFYLLPFEVSPAVLIPRPETETLVLAALDLMKTRPGARVLDLGTGSGCIAISLAHQSPAAQVTAVDLSPDALEIARRNAHRHGVMERVTFLQGDLFKPVPAGAQFDVIVSNPPYVTCAELAELAPEVRDHEPRLALDGGTDGLNVYRRIAAEARPYLAPGGTVLVEHGYQQGESVRAIFAETGWQVRPTVKDAAGLPRVTIATASSQG